MRERSTVFVIDQDKLLLIHRFKNGEEYYAVPGGGIEVGETEEQAAIRELKEEANLDVTIGEQIGTLELDGEAQHFYLAKSFRGKLKLGGPEIDRQSPDNSYQLAWIPLIDLDHIALRKEIKEVLFRQLSPFSHFLGTTVTAIIDRPMGSKHPKWNFKYEINYGYISNTKSGDGEEIDTYVLGATEPIKEFTGVCIAIVHRLDDDDDKLILAPSGKNFTTDEIRTITAFQEKFFTSIIVR